MTVADCLQHLEQLAPSGLAEPWDNIGLLIGAREAAVRRIMTCLTLTSDVAREALDGGVDLIVAHHPLLFRPVQRITGDTAEGALLLSLIRGGVSVCSPHTAFDSAALGINQRLAIMFELTDIAPLRPATGELAVGGAGGGRRGMLPSPCRLSDLIDRCRRLLPTAAMQFVGEPARMISQVALACGSAGEFIPDAVKAGCDVLITGEARFHAALEAREAGLALILAGHYATERPGVEALAVELASSFPQLEVWASRVETDPLRSP